MVVDLNGNGHYEILTAWKIQPDPVGGGQDFNPFIDQCMALDLGEPWRKTGRAAS